MQKNLLIQSKNLVQILNKYKKNFTSVFDSGLSKEKIFVFDLTENNNVLLN
jgi:hypothetical protein